MAADPTRPAVFPRWTVVVAAGVAVLNVGLFVGGPAAEFLSRLELERRAILAGEPWRFLTANMVHWSREHFLLDLAAFLALGWLSESHFRRSYPFLLLWIALWVGLGGMWFLDDRAYLRGLSGVNAGQFAVLLWVEVGAARREPRRWLWVGPALACYLVWVGYGAVTGRAVLGSGDHAVAGWAHLAGALAALGFLALQATARPGAGFRRG